MSNCLTPVEGYGNGMCCSKCGSVLDTCSQCGNVENIATGHITTRRRRTRKWRIGENGKKNI